ncbi:protein FAM195A-like protein, partial [Dinothrombium tinctorium]
GNTNKLFVKTRRGISQKLENFENQQKDGIKGFNSLPVNNISTAKPVFHVANGKKPSHQKSNQETVSPQHEEMIKYIHDTWKNVQKDYELCCKANECNGISNSNRRVPKISYYKASFQNSQLPKFEPFDLETFWGQRLFHNLTQTP